MFDPKGRPIHLNISISRRKFKYFRTTRTLSLEIVKKLSSVKRPPPPLPSHAVSHPKLVTLEERSTQNRLFELSCPHDTSNRLHVGDVFLSRCHGPLPALGEC